MTTTVKITNVDEGMCFPCSIEIQQLSGIKKIVKPGESSDVCIWDLTGDITIKEVQNDSE